jgi:hypothetical protein
MGWERKNPVITCLPKEPSLNIWLIAGIMALLGSIALFVLHANMLLGPLQLMNVWVISSGPLCLWLFFVCLRAAIYNAAFNRHAFATNEAEYAQQRWTEWAGRYLAVLHSRAILPDAFTASQFIQPPPGLEQHGQQTRRISWGETKSLTICLRDVTDSLLSLPSELTLNVTLLSDSLQSDSTLQQLFDECWSGIMPDTRPVPYLTILRSHSLMKLEERIKSPEISVELIVIQQLQGRDKYSDALAVLLLASDDIATKYQLTHDARLLRPMTLDSGRLQEELELFFTTQTQANSTQFIAGDRQRWANDFVEILKASADTGGYWKTEQVGWLENFVGVSGPLSPWIMAAVSSDIVRLQQVDCLMLSSDGKQSFINTVTTGNQNNGNR